jgi:hypothetical protein
MAHDLLGANTMEWAEVDGDLFVLQLGRPPRPEVSTTSFDLPESGDLLSLVRLLRRYPGAIGAAFVLPWALALRDPTLLDDVLPQSMAHPEQALASARAIATELMLEVWGYDAAAAEAALAKLAGDPAAVLPLIQNLAPPNLHRAQEVVALVRGAGKALTGARVLRHPDDVWHLDSTAIGRSVGVVAMDRWEPLQHFVVGARGLRVLATPGSPGRGFGRLLFVSRPNQVDCWPSRAVIVVSEPLPQFAPLLWGSAGLIALNGGPAAHLFEVARSLGVPAVAGCQLDRHLGNGFDQGPLAVALDGGEGWVATMDW